jgi:hypothetical protein
MPNPLLLLASQMNISLPRLFLRYIILPLIAIGIAVGLIIHIRELDYKHDLSQLKEMKEELSVTKQHLIGYTKFTDYITATTTALSEQTKLITAKVVRDYVHVEHIQRVMGPISSYGAIQIDYTIEYSIGYDLSPKNFEVSSDDKGLIITLRRPSIVASPAVIRMRPEVINSGVFVSPRDAIIALQGELPTIARAKAPAVSKEEAVVALCEKKLGDFIQDFLSKQKGVSHVPKIRFVYL